MVKKCAAIGCKSKPGVTDHMFHRFPFRDSERMMKWLRICPPDLNVEKGVPHLCSKHFLDDHYVIVGNRKKLKHNAVPYLAVKKIQNKASVQDKAGGHLESTSDSRDSTSQDPLSLHNEVPSTKTLPDTTTQEEDDTDDCITVQVNMKDTYDKEKDNLSPHQSLILENAQLKSENQDLKLQINHLKCQLLQLEKQVEKLGKVPEVRRSFANNTLDENLSELT